MALTRTIVQNDSGSGNDGTIATNEWLQGVWNTIDSRWTEKTITDTGTVNNLSLVDGGIEADRLLCNNASDLTITGIAAPASPSKPGKMLIISAVGNGNVYLPFDSSSSSAGNRFFNLATSAPTPLSAHYGRAIYKWSPITTSWELIAHEQGGWITPTFAAGDFTASVGSWTVESGDISPSGVMKYRLQGRTLQVVWYIASTTVVTGGGILRIGNGQWGSFTSSNPVEVPFRGSDNGGAFTMTRLAAVTSGATVISLYTDASGGTWTAGTNNNTVIGTLQFEVN